MTVPEGDEVTDLERLDEALERWRENEAGSEGFILDYEQEIELALLTYRDLLANGVGPDYEAAAEERLRQDQAIFEDRPFDWDPDTRAIVDAAIGGRLLVVPPKEEER